jgi:V-type H+-transporting ATPase subunit C
MTTSTKYLFVSFPRDEDTFDTLKAAVEGGAVLPFQIPNFKIGTLDALVQQADDLSKLESACQGVVAKVSDSLRTLLDGNEDKIAQQKTVNDSTFPILPPISYNPLLLPPR